MKATILCALGLGSACSLLAGALAAAGGAAGPGWLDTEVLLKCSDPQVTGAGIVFVSQAVSGANGQARIVYARVTILEGGEEQFVLTGSQLVLAGQPTPVALTGVGQVKNGAVRTPTVLISPLLGTWNQVTSPGHLRTTLEWSVAPARSTGPGKPLSPKP